jgi:glycerophosphoryl diester phosphodiesterase
LIAKAKEINADGLDLSASLALDQAFADKVRAAKLELHVWTVNDLPTARRMVEIGVDGITTDRPGWLREQLGGQSRTQPAHTHTSSVRKLSGSLR